MSEDMEKEAERCLQCGYSNKSQSHISNLSEATVALTRTNEPPPPNAFGTLRESYLTSETRLDDVNSQILRMEASLKALRLEQIRLKGLVKTYKQILHPIRRLPAEILREIYQLVEHDDHRFTTIDGNVKRCFLRDTLVSSRLPWILGQVCHQWREVAMSCTALWSNIGFELPDPTLSQERLAVMVAQLMLQIQRSGTQPLTIHIKSPRNLSTCHPLLIAACAHSARWENVYIHVGQDSVEALQRLATMIKGNIPILQRLRLSLNTEDDVLENVVCDAFSIAPKLYSLSIMDSQGFSKFLKVGWKQITHGYVHALDPVELSDTLSRLKNVRYLSLMYQKREGLTCSPITLPQLHTLFMITRPPRNHSAGINSVLDRIVAPNLYELRVSIKGPKVGSFPQLLTRSAASLRSLSLKASDLLGEALSQLLECVPALESLSLWDVTNEVLSALAEIGYTGKPRLVPELLVLGLFGEKKFFDSSVTALVCDRRAVDSQLASTAIYLRTVKLESTLGVSEETILGLSVDVKVEIVPRRDVWSLPNV
ncbi:hypothetical protein Moror_10810 [Moniliophthora roreri MCA 2997]|uniref:F-box domain-containing protein n=1 Tax=Moniliophthora roreri (strain MCA 2997) TaxID=1381753 RepID=V2X6A0_MONRO|nr:hypothetical protein Moror_10810 [Moniliophthora roreri MCA 2997]